MSAATHPESSVSRPPRARGWSAVVALVGAGALLASACGSDSDDDASSGTSASTEPAPATQPVADTTPATDPPETDLSEPDDATAGPDDATAEPDDATAEPDDATPEPESDEPVAPAPETDAADEADPGVDQPAAATEPVTVTARADFSNSDVQGAAQPNSRGILGEVSFTGVTTQVGEVSGTAEWLSQGWFLPDGSTVGAGEFVFTGTIEGLGSGTLSYDDRWEIVDGIWSATATITGGTGDFVGAYGSSVSTSDPADPASSDKGTVVWEITVPPVDSLVNVTATGTALDEAGTAGPGEADGLIEYAFTTVFDGMISGAAPHTGSLWFLDDGSQFGGGDFEFTGTIDGLGEGTMTYLDIFTRSDAGAEYSVTITGGTGDFEGITGTGTFTDGAEGEPLTYEFALSAPVGGS